MPISPATVRGTGGAVVQGRRTRATIAIREANEGQAYGWGIYSGTCQNLGALQGGEAVYTPLTASSTGRASDDVALSTVLDREQDYAIRVNRDGTGTSVACGDLEPL